MNPSLHDTSTSDNTQTSKTRYSTVLFPLPTHQLFVYVVFDSVSPHLLHCSKNLAFFSVFTHKIFIFIFILLISILTILKISINPVSLTRFSMTIYSRKEHNKTFRKAKGFESERYVVVLSYFKNLVFDICFPCHDEL